MQDYCKYLNLIAYIYRYVVKINCPQIGSLADLSGDKKKVVFNCFCNMNKTSSLGGNVSSVGGGNNPILPRKSEQSRVSRIDADDLKSRVDISEVYSALYPDKFQNQKKGGNDLLVSCYAHGEDKNPSMAISDSKGLMNCYACGEAGDVYHLIQKALGCDFPQAIEWLASFTGVYVPSVDYGYQKPIPKVSSDRTVTIYQYDDRFTVHRIKVEGEPKDFRQYFNGELYNKAKHPQFPMYRQGMAAASVADGNYWIQDHEGEKCVDFAWQLGYPAVTPYGNLAKGEYLATYKSLKALTDRPFGLLIFEDNDPRGRTKAEAKIGACQSLGIPHKVVRWSEHIEVKGGDVEDYVGKFGEDKFRELVGSSLATPIKPRESSKLVALPTRRSAATIDPDTLRSEFIEFLESSPRASEIAAFKVGRSLSQEQCKFLDIVKTEVDREQQADDSRHELEDLIKAGKAEIDLLDYFPQSFARPLKQWAADVKVPESCLMTVLLPCIARFLGKSEILLSRRTNWKQPPNIFSCLVGSSGAKKSPIFKAIAYDPIALLQETIDEEYQQKLEEYESYQRLSKEEKENTEEPAKPERFLLFLSNLTAENLHYLSEAYPDKGQMILSDEISGYFANQNRYSSSGAGGDKEEILSYYDGQGQSVGRRSGMLGGRRFNLSIAGATQNEILDQLMSRRGTNTGEWARFLLCYLPFTRSDWELEDSDLRIDFSPMLAAMYKQLESQPKQMYSLSAEAFATHKRFCNYVEGLAIQEANPGLSKAYIKASGQVGRLALILHCAVYAIAQVPPSSEIGAGTMMAAEKLMRFYLGQAKRLYGIQEPDSVNPMLLKILEIAGTKGYANPGDVVRCFSGKKRPSQDLVKESMYQLQTMGLGRVEKSGKSIRFCKSQDIGGNLDNVDKNSGNRDKNLDKLGLAQTPYTAKVVDDEKKNSDNLDNFSDSLAENQEFSQLENSSENLSRLSRLPEKKLETLAGDGLQNSDNVITIPPKIINIPPNLSRFPNPPNNGSSSVQSSRPVDLCDVAKGSLVMARRSESSPPEPALVVEIKPQLKLKFDSQPQKKVLSTIRYVVEVLQK
jgi:DNA primase